MSFTTAAAARAPASSMLPPTSRVTRMRRSSVLAKSLSSSRVSAPITLMYWRMSCQQCYRWHPEENATQTAATSW